VVLEVGRAEEAVLGTVDEDRGFASVDEGGAGVAALASLEDGRTDEVVLATKSEDDGASLELRDELGTSAELEAGSELDAPELATDSVEEAASEDEMLDMTEERIELALDRSALLVRVVTGTKDELSLLTDVMTEDEAGVVGVGSAGVVLGVVGWLGVVDLVVLGVVVTSPLLVEVTVTPLTVTVVGRVTLAVDTVTVVLPRTVVVTAGAV
jgi:hypothetical protein